MPKAKPPLRTRKQIEDRILELRVKMMQPDTRQSAYPLFVVRIQELEWMLGKDDSEQI